MGDHSSKQYDLDLEAIRSKALIMGRLVERHFSDAITTFANGDIAKADEIVRSDEQVNSLEVALDNACSHLIVKRHPAANDLRAIMATIKVITHLERIGDESTKIARTAKELHGRGVNGALNHFETVRPIFENAADLLHDSLDAFDRLDERRAAQIIARDEVINHEFRSTLRVLITFMMEDPRTISTALDTLWVAKAIERVGDHAKSIAEYVIYIVEGKDIRHTDYVHNKLNSEA